jgi:hypothetical protein
MAVLTMVGNTLPSAWEYCSLYLPIHKLNCQDKPLPLKLITAFLLQLALPPLADLEGSRSCDLYLASLALSKPK